MRWARALPYLLKQRLALIAINEFGAARRRSIE
jgi:hypothetical protein